MVIQHNMDAMLASLNINKSQKNLKSATQRLSTGYRINSAVDDAAGLTISEKLRWQIRGLNRASENISDGTSLVQVADGALQEVHAMLDRIKELTVQAANDTNAEADRAAIQQEIDMIKAEINRISTDTTFNEIKVFKPTKVPEIKGRPTDILVYHEDGPGGVREGGIIYGGKRYAYEDMENLKYDANGNIQAGNYVVSVYAEDGQTPIEIELMFDGGSRVPSGRKYELDPREDGIYIDLVKHDWKDIKNTDGASLDPDNLVPGEYSFHHAGLTISFNVEEGMDLPSLLGSLKEDGLDTYMLRSSDVTTEEKLPINPSISISDVSPVDTAKKDYIPGTTNSNISNYKMDADDDGLYMYIPAENSMTGKEEILTKRSWDDLGLTEWKRYDPNQNKNDWVNPGSTVSGGEQSKQYTYKDDITGITINFSVDSEVSKGELISAIKNWQITVETNNKMNFESVTTGNVDITAGWHSPSLDSYKTQYDMGRPIPNSMTLASNEPLAYSTSGDRLSFDITDANGKVYTFSSSNVTNNVKNRVQSDLRSYIYEYAGALEDKWNGYGSSMPSAKDTDKISFTSDSGGYAMDLTFAEDFSGWLAESNFTKTYNPNTQRWIASYNTANLLNLLENRVNTLTSDIVDSLKKTSISIGTDNGPTSADNTASSPLTTTNKRYSSLVISGDREVKIQAGCQNQQYIAIKLPPMNTAVLKIGVLDVSSYPSASASLSQVEGAIAYVSEMRSGYGATQNRLEAAKSIDDTTSENSQAAESLLRDADMAEESITYAKHNILLQAGQSILAQANQQPENVVRILG